MKISIKSQYHTLLNYSTGTCRYKKFPDNRIVQDEGNRVYKEIGFFLRNTVDNCKQLCDGIAECNSFRSCDGWRLVGDWRCYPKDKLLDGSEPTKWKSNCTTYYQHCSKKLYKFRLTIPLLNLIINLDYR